jgi:hypothetical protein
LRCLCHDFCGFLLTGRFLLTGCFPFPAAFLSGSFPAARILSFRPPMGGASGRYLDNGGAPLTRLTAGMLTRGNLTRSNSVHR